MKQSALIVLVLLLASAVQCDASPTIPTATPALPTSAPMLPTATPTWIPTSPMSLTPTPVPTVPPEPTMTAPAPTSSQPAILAQGQFMDANSAHHGSGTVTVVRHPDGRLVLQFEGFTVTDGPGLHVYLVTTDVPRSAADLVDHVDLGELQSVRGDQMYDIPGDPDLLRYQSVVIYCVPYQVLFSYATLIR